MEERHKVLVVDDEQVILDSARRILASVEMQVLTALDAESALTILKTESPDLLISDLMLPGATGIELLEAAGEHDPTLVAIITTGFSTVDNAVVSLKRGAFDFIPKPFSYDEFLSSVRRACRAVDLRLPHRAWVAKGEQGPHLALGTQTWALLEGSGSALLGVTELQLRTIGPIERFELPETGDELRQGGSLVRLHSADGLVHTLWSPLSGLVLEQNDRLSDELIRQDPAGAGWIVRILATNPEEERRNLL